MPPTVQAALLGVLQGLTEFLPGVVDRAPADLGERLLGYQDPGGVFTVLIQLGSILAIMWLYRAKLIDVLAGLPSRHEARRFALDDRRRLHSRADRRRVPGRLRQERAVRKSRR